MSKSSAFEEQYLISLPREKAGRITENPVTLRAQRVPAHVTTRSSQWAMNNNQCTDRKADDYVTERDGGHIYLRTEYWMGQRWIKGRHGRPAFRMCA